MSLLLSALTSTRSHRAAVDRSGGNSLIDAKLKHFLSML